MTRKLFAATSAILFACCGMSVFSAPAYADCSAAPLETSTDLAISFLTASGTQAAPATLLAASDKKGMLVYDGTANLLKYCDGNNWVALMGAGNGVGISAAGAANEVQFRDTATGGLAANANFVFDTTNTRLGIGTAAPNMAVDIKGTGTGGAISISRNDSSPVVSLRRIRGDFTTPLPVQAGDHLGRIAFHGEGTDAATPAAIDAFAREAFTPTARGTDLSFKTVPLGTVPSVEVMRIRGEGNVGIGTPTPDASSLLDLTSTTRGFLPPRMDEAQRDAITSPATGLVIYNTDDSALNFWDGDSWEAVGTGTGGGGGLPATYFVGTALTYSVPNSTWTTINWTQQQDVGGDNYNPTTGVFTAPVAGFYQFSADTGFGWLANGSLVGIQLSSSSGIVCRATNNDSDAVSLYAEISCSGGIYLAAGATVSAALYQTSGAARTMNGRFSGVLVGGSGGGGGGGSLAGKTLATMCSYSWPGSATGWRTRVWQAADCTNGLPQVGDAFIGSGGNGNGTNGAHSCSYTEGAHYNHATEHGATSGNVKCAYFRTDSGGGGGGSSTLAGLSDVAVGTPTNGQALVWNNATSKWEPGAAGGAEISFLGYGTTISLPNSTATDITFSNQAFDNGGDNFNPTTGKFTVPETGTYTFSASIDMAIASGRAHGLIQTDAAGFGGSQICGASVPAGGTSLSCTGTTRLTAGTVVEFVVQQTTGSAVTPTSTRTTFSGFKVGSGGSGGGGGSSTLAGLSDVAVGTPTNGQALVWNNATSKWEPGAAGGAGASGRAWRASAYTPATTSTYYSIPLNAGNAALNNVTHSTSVNPERMTVTNAGTYIVSYGVHSIYNPGGSTNYARIAVNGTGVVGSESMISEFSNNYSSNLSRSIVLALNAGDYVSLQYQQNAAGNSLASAILNIASVGGGGSGGGGGSSQWDDVTGGINYAGGKVGIGVAAPATRLQVGGDASGITGFLPTVAIIADGVNDGGTALRLRGAVVGGSVLGVHAPDNTPTFAVQDDGSIRSGGTTSGPHASAQLDVISTTKGFLPPRMTTAQRDAIASPATGLTVYNTTTSALNFYTGTAWAPVTTSSASPAFLVTKTDATQALVSGWQKLNLNSEVFDTNNNFASSRFTPTVPGKYLLTTTVRFYANGLHTAAGIAKNGTVLSYDAVMGTAANDSSTFSMVVEANGTGDYFEVYVWGPSTGASVYIDTAGATSFSGSLIGGGSSGGGGSSTLAGLTDVTVGTPANGQALVWNNATSKWEPGAVMGGATPVAFMAVKGAAQSLPTGAPVTIIFDNQLRDDGGNNYNPATGVFTAPHTGYYFLSAGGYAGQVGTILQCYMRVNGTNVSRDWTYAASLDPHCQINTLHYLNAGDAVDIQISQNSGNTNTTTATASPYLWFKGFAVNNAAGGGGGSSQWADVTGGINYTSGKVGVGTPAPQAQLQVNGNISMSGEGSLFGFNTYWNGANNRYEYIADGFGALVRIGKEAQSQGGDIQFRVLPKNTLGAGADAGTTGGLTAMTIKNDGSIGIGSSTPAATSLLDLTSTTKGFLPPRMTTVQRDAIASPEAGLTIYNTTTKALEVFNGTVWGPKDTVYVYATQNTGVAIGDTNTIIPYANESIDTHSAFNPSTGVFTAPQAGYYLVDAAWYAAVPAGHYNYINVLKNGGFARSTLGFNASTGTAGRSAHISTVLQLAANDTVRIGGLLSGGSTTTNSGAAYNYLTITSLNTTSGGGGGSSTPGGLNKHVQFNDGGSTLGGVADFTWDKAAKLLDVTGTTTANTLRLKTTAGNPPSNGSGTWMTNGSNVWRTGGRVGIGTAAPVSLLDVVHSGDDMNAIRLGDPVSTASITGIYLRSTTEGRILVGTGASLVFMRNGGTTETMRIDASGNVLFGMSATSLSTPGAYFEPSASLNYGRLNFVKANAGTTYTVAFYYGGAQIGNIANNTTSTAYNTTSDRRLKEHIASTEKGLDTLMRIDVKDFNFIDDSAKTRVQGFIAQELYGVYPEAVSVGGEDAQEKPWSVDYGRLTPLLVKAVQELKAENDGLKARLDDLTKRLEALEAKE